MGQKTKPGASSAAKVAFDRAEELGALAALTANYAGFRGITLGRTHDYIRYSLDSVRIADVPAIGTKIESGQPVCTLLVSRRDLTSIATAFGLSNPDGSSEVASIGSGLVQRLARHCDRYGNAP